MAKFNGDYKNEYAMLLMGEYFRNSLTYFRGEVRDSNYFRPLLRMADERTIEQAIYDIFGGEDLVKCDVARFCEREGGHAGERTPAPHGELQGRDGGGDELHGQSRRSHHAPLHFQAPVRLPRSGWQKALFERMFKTRLSDAEVRRLVGIPNLAPGDFRTVRQSLFYLGGAVSNETRLNELEKESSLKKGMPRRIGF